MVSTRFNAVRGEIVRLETKFYLDGSLYDPYSENSMSISIINPSGSIIYSGLTPIKQVVGHYYYDFQTTSGMSIGNYKDVWYGIQYTDLDPITSGIFPFTLSYSQSDLADWDLLPG